MLGVIEEVLGAPGCDDGGPWEASDGDEGAVGFQESVAAVFLETARRIGGEHEESFDDVFEAAAGVEEGPIGDGAKLMVGIVEEGGGLDVAVSPALRGGHGQERVEAFEVGSVCGIWAEELLREAVGKGGLFDARGIGELLGEEAVHPGQAKADLRDVVLGEIVRGQCRAGGGEGDEHSGILRAFGGAAARFVLEEGDDGEAVLIQGVDGAGDEVEVLGREGLRIQVDEVFFFLGGEKFEGVGLTAAGDLAEPDDAPEAEVAGEEAVEKVGLVVVHGGIIREGGMTNEE